MFISKKKHENTCKVLRDENEKLKMAISVLSNLHDEEIEDHLKYIEYLETCDIDELVELQLNKYVDKIEVIEMEV